MSCQHLLQGTCAQCIAMQQGQYNQANQGIGLGQFVNQSHQCPDPKATIELRLERRIEQLEKELKTKSNELEEHQKALTILKALK